MYIYIYIYTYIYIKSHSGQLSIATSSNPSVVNTICINSFRYTQANVATDEGNSRNEM